MAPSMCERKVTPWSATLRSCESDMTWKPPESVRIGYGQFMKRVQAAERGNPLGAGAQHQVIGVGEHDLCAGCAHGFGRKTFHRRLCAHRHEKRRCDQPVRGRDLAAAGVAVRRQQAEGKECVVHRRRHRR